MPRGVSERIAKDCRPLPRELESHVHSAKDWVRSLCRHDLLLPTRAVTTINRYLTVDESVTHALNFFYTSCQRFETKTINDHTYALGTDANPGQYSDMVEQVR